jgi:hypothetical protein
MGNNCDVWFEVDGTNEIIDKIFQELTTIGYNGCYGYYKIHRVNDKRLEVYGTTKWEPPVEMFNTWLNTYDGLKLECMFKEEFLHYAGIWNAKREHAEMVDFTVVKSNDVRSATSGLLYKLEKKLGLSAHMDTPYMNDSL